MIFDSDLRKCVMCSVLQLHCQIAGEQRNCMKYFISQDILFHVKRHKS